MVRKTKGDLVQGWELGGNKAGWWLDEIWEIRGGRGGWRESERGQVSD
jgi:hypothetical protein